MADKFATIEGNADAVAVTAANSGYAAVVNSTGTMEYDSGVSGLSTINLTRAIQVNASATSGANYLQDTWTATTTTLDFEAMYRFSAGGTAGGPPLIWAGASGTTRGFVIQLDATGHLVIYDAGASGGAVIYTSTGIVPASTWVRIAGWAVPSATTGQIRVAVFQDNTTTPLTGLDSGLLTGRNLGASFGGIRYGKTLAGTYATVFHMAHLGYDTAGSGAFMAPPATTPPTAAAGVWANAVVVNARDSSTAGNGGALTFGTPTLVSGPVRNFEALTPGVYAFDSNPAASIYRFPVTEGTQTVTIDKTLPALTEGAPETGHTRIRVKVGGVPV